MHQTAPLSKAALSCLFWFWNCTDIADDSWFTFA